MENDEIVSFLASPVNAARSSQNMYNRPMQMTSYDSVDVQSWAAEIHHRFLLAYGEPSWRPSYAPMDELVLTFLSQNTSDLNSGRAFQGLKARFPDWHAVIAAPADEVADAIRSGGLADRKAPRIQKALRRILEERGEFNIDFLADLPVDDAMH